MKKLFYVSTILLFSVIFITSCTKQDAVTGTVQPAAEAQFKLSNVKFENGMLVFNTKADMDSAFQMVQRGQATVSNWLYAQFPGFVSQVTALNALTTQDSANIVQASTVPVQYANFVRKNRKEGVDFVDRVIENNILGNIVNKAGFFGYSDKVIKVNYDYTYEISKDVYLQSPNKDVYSASSAKIDPVIHNIHYLKEANDLKPRSNIDYFTIPLYGGVKRWSGILYSSDYPWNNFLEITTRYEGQRGWFGWWATDQASVMGVSGTATIAVHGSGGKILSYYDIGFPQVFQRDVGIVASSVSLSSVDEASSWHTYHYCLDYNGNAHFGYLDR